METLKESPDIKDVAYSASRLQYWAIAELLSASLQLENCPGKEFLEPAINKLNKAWSISKNRMSKEDFKKHGANWKPIFEIISKYNKKEFEKFFEFLAHFLNNDAEKDFKKGRKKLAGVILTDKNSAVKNLRRAAGLTI